MKYAKLISDLDALWDDDGFLGRLREGVFQPNEGLQFLSFLRSISLYEDENVPMRLVALLWYVPSFVGWQRDRVAEHGGDTAAFARFVTEVHDAMETVLGVP